jgi:hypothetical protein
VPATPTSAATNADPRFSPTYPQRVHARERGHWDELLARWERRIAEAAAGLAGRADQSEGERLLARMSGARDQLADAVRRLPLEAGDLYREDRHRADEAIGALERLFRQR